MSMENITVYSDDARKKFTLFQRWSPATLTQSTRCRSTGAAPWWRPPARTSSWGWSNQELARWSTRWLNLRIAHLGIAYFVDNLELGQSTITFYIPGSSPLRHEGFQGCLHRRLGKSFHNRLLKILGQAVRCLESARPEATPEDWEHWLLQRSACALLWPGHADDLCGGKGGWERKILRGGGRGTLGLLP